MQVLNYNFLLEWERVALAYSEIKSVINWASKKLFRFLQDPFHNALGWWRSRKGEKVAKPHMVDIAKLSDAWPKISMKCWILLCLKGIPGTAERLTLPFALLILWLGHFVGLFSLYLRWFLWDYHFKSIM
jgi:hypothetical protein